MTLRELIAALEAIPESQDCTVAAYEGERSGVVVWSADGKTQVAFIELELLL